jgi:hypothetical protein
MNDDFDAVLDKYSAWKGSWSLFTAICLLQKIDPGERGKPIDHTMPTDDPDGGTDYTIRPYKIALEAIQEAKAGRQPGKGEPPNLVEVEYRPDEIGAKRHYVNLRTFVKWACTRWPEAIEHLARAEARYRKAKEPYGWTTEQKRKFAKSEFKKMVEEERLDVSKRRGKIRAWARMLEGRMPLKDGSPLYDAETLRKAIPGWIDELG